MLRAVRGHLPVGVGQEAAGEQLAEVEAGWL
jgi:hypothetical protein